MLISRDEKSWFDVEVAVFIKFRYVIPSLEIPTLIAAMKAHGAIKRHTLEEIHYER